VQRCSLQGLVDIQQHQGIVDGDGVDRLCVAVTNQAKCIGHLKATG
jgi:hypothetical protein